MAGCALVATNEQTPRPSLPWQRPRLPLHRALGSLISEAICSESRIPEPFKQSPGQGKEPSPLPSHVCAHAREHTHTTCTHAHARTHRQMGHGPPGRTDAERTNSGGPAPTSSGARVACLLRSPSSPFPLPLSPADLCLSSPPLSLLHPHTVSCFARGYLSPCPITCTRVSALPHLHPQPPPVFFSSSLSSGGFWSWSGTSSLDTCAPSSLSSPPLPQDGQGRGSCWTLLSASWPPYPGRPGHSLHRDPSRSQWFPNPNSNP